MNAFNITRLVLFAVLCIFSLIVLGVLANFTNITTQAGFYYHSFALGIAVSVMCLAIVIAAVIIEKFRRGAITSLVWFELAWMGFVWVMWLATAAAITGLGIFTSCGFFNAQVESNCRQYQAVQAFSWLNWLISFGWFTALLICSIIAASKGHASVWKMPVTEHPLFTKGGNSPYGQHVTYPTAPAPTGTPYGQPTQGYPGSEQGYMGQPSPMGYNTATPTTGYNAGTPTQGYPTPAPYGQPLQPGMQAPQHPGYPQA